MATEERLFHLGDILSITTGLLVSPDHIDGVHRILDYMTGDTLFTHQLPRACDQCAPVLLEQLPQLRAVQEPSEQTRSAGSDWVEPWLAAQVALFGEQLPVAPIAPAQRIVRDPITELHEMVGKDRTIVVHIEKDKGE